MHGGEPDQADRPIAGAVAVLVAVSIWGAMAVVIRWVDEIDGLVLGFHRLWIGALGTLAVFYGTGRRLSWHSLRLALTGGLAFGGDIVLFFSAVKHTTVANATVVGALQPILVFFIAERMFGEAVTRRLVVWSVVAIGGVALVVYGSSGVPTWSIGGDLLAIAALFAWTVYFVASKQVRTQLAPFEYLAALLLIAAVAIAPIAAGLGPAARPWRRRGVGMDHRARVGVGRRRPSARQLGPWSRRAGGDVAPDAGGAGGRRPERRGVRGRAGDLGAGRRHGRRAGFPGPCRGTNRAPSGPDRAADRGTRRLTQPTASASISTRSSGIARPVTPIRVAATGMPRAENRSTKAC